MIPFFRKIRKKMADDNRPLKYARYAIGEIVLVVIGILIALQINNWNEARLDRQDENKILTLLYLDFQDTQKNLNHSIETYNKIEQHITNKINCLGMNPDSLTSDNKNQLMSSYMPITNIITGSLNSIINSNKLELIVNDSLKVLLTKYPSIVNQFNKSEENWEDCVINVTRPVLEKHLSISAFLFDDKKYPELQSRTIPSNYKDLLNSLEYQNSLVNENFHLGHTRRRALLLMSANEKILFQLRQELK